MSKIFVISGPSGSGKTTLLRHLIKDRRLSKRLVKSISLTTRPKRSGERQGKDYFFVSKKQFTRKRKAKKILEWTRYLGYDYATPKDFIDGQLHKSKNVLLCLDLRGALKIKHLYPQNTVAIFVAPPSLKALQDRIKKRCKKTAKEEVQKRLRLAQKELQASRRYDYCLVNRDLSTAIKRLKSIILKEATS